MELGFYNSAVLVLFGLGLCIVKSVWVALVAADVGYFGRIAYGTNGYLSQKVLSD
jgi:hypothetical protein